jgi:predicted nucleic acid-binding protein
VLVDTSVWVDHLRQGNAELPARLASGEVLTHPFVVGELACGHLSKRAKVLALLEALPATPVAEPREALGFVESQRLQGAGIRWIDVHSLASARLAHVPLWTLDRKLASVARSLRVVVE